jgi:small subunit ribosomal protein S6
VSEKYETVFAFKIQPDEEAQKALLSRFTDMIAQNGTVDGIDEWGKRRLAYEINDEQEAYYVVVSFTSDPAFPAELERIANITDDVLRSLTVRKPEEKVKK